MEFIISIISILVSLHVEAAMARDRAFVSCAVQAAKRLFPSSQPLGFSLSFSGESSVEDLYWGNLTTYVGTIQDKSPLCSWDNTTIVSIAIDSYLNMYINNVDLYTKNIILNSGEKFDVQSEVLEELHRTELWSLVVSSLTSSQLKSGIVVLTSENIEDQIHLMADLKVYADNSKLLVLLRDGFSRKIVDRVFRVFSGRNYKDVFILVQGRERGHVMLFTWNPYHPPSGICGNFNQSVLLDTCVDGAFIKEAYPMKRIFIKGCKLSLVSEKDVYIPPLVFEKFGYLEGVNVRLMNIISEQMEMTPVTRYPPEIGQSSIVLFSAPVPGIAFTRPYFTLSFTFFVPRSGPYPLWSSVTRVFSWSGWIAIFLCLLVTAGALIFMTGNGRAVLDVWSVILGVGVNSPPQTTPARLVFYSWVLFSLCIVTVYQTYMTSYFVDPGFLHQIDTLEELLALKVQLVFDMEVTVFFSSYADKSENPVATFFPLTSLKYFLHTPQTSVFTNERILSYYTDKLCTVRGEELFHKFSAEFAQIHFGFFLQQNVILDERLNKIVAYLVQAGLPDKFDRETSDLRVKLKSEEYFPMSVTHLQSPFLFFFFGLGLSLVALCSELLIHATHKKFRINHGCKI